MIHAMLGRLADWGPLDTWIAVTAALAAMACALPGVFLVLRRQSLMGDALTHTVLPGIVAAFLLAFWLKSAGWITPQTYRATEHAALFLGAIGVGVFSAVLTEWLQRLGGVEGTAALGVVYTTLFAVGLLLVRVAADSVHIDPDCVLYGTIETVAMDTLRGLPIERGGIPRAAVVNGGVLCVNLLLVALFYKELRITAFDPALATTLGIPARLLHYALMAATAVTLVSAFESVGSILVIAMLIAPAATACLLSDRLARIIALSLGLAGAAAVLGHVLAISVPPVVFARLGFDTVESAGTAGMMAVACGLLFVAAMMFAPRHGVISRIMHRAGLGLRIAAEDVLGSLYRREEAGAAAPPSGGAAHAAASRMTSELFRDQTQGISPLLRRLAQWKLTWSGLVAGRRGAQCLTPAGRRAAEELVRAHRLWESYMATHFQVPSDHLHETAAKVEHYLGPALRAEIAAELDRPDYDPHGRAIPPETARTVGHQPPPAA
jgi:manganese/zinc/iron transport system permease protein